ncbi:hypothetical protein ACOMHN_021036 [Nucella lapillus]
MPIEQLLSSPEDTSRRRRREFFWMTKLSFSRPEKSRRQKSACDGAASSKMEGPVCRPVYAVYQRCHTSSIGFHSRSNSRF